MSFSICGTGMYVPVHTVTNEDLSALVETDDEWITTRVGVRERHIAVTETTAYMATEAARAALENSGISAQELDLILCATVSADSISPSLACMVQKGIGAHCMAFDINAACAAFLFLLDTAAGYFAGGRVKNVLIVGAERMSRIVDWEDRSTCVIFGDGAGAAVLCEHRPLRQYVICLYSDRIGCAQSERYAAKRRPPDPLCIRRRSCQCRMSDHVAVSIVCHHG